MRKGALYFKLRAIGRVFKRDGPVGLARAIGHRFSAQHAREKRRKTADALEFDSPGFDTGGVAFLDQLLITEGDSGDANPYDATPSYDFETALATLATDIAGTTFVDLGSGKGRVLLLATRYAFARIIGVEFAQDLQTIAAKNLRRHAEIAGPDPRIILHTGDAATFLFPPEPLIVFLFNPFGAITMRKVARALHGSWKATPRLIRVIYLNPQHGVEWRAAGFRRMALGPDRAYAIYSPE